MTRILLITICCIVSFFESHCMRLDGAPKIPSMKCINSALGINEWDYQSFGTIATEIFKTQLEPATIANRTIGIAGAPLPIHNQFRGANAVQFGGAAGINMMQHYGNICDAIHSDNPASFGIISRMNNVLGQIHHPLIIDDFIEFIDHISMKSQQGQDVPHIALARIITIDADNKTYAYPMPYIFMSGRIQNGMNRILQRARVDLRDLLGLHQNIPINVINQLATDITINAQGGAIALPAWVPQITPNIQQSAKFLHIAHSIIGGINGLETMCSDVELYGVNAVNIMNFYHSERAIGLCLCNQFLGVDLLNDSINLHNNVYPQAQANNFVIQIKCSLPSCENCQNFWRGNALINAAWQFVQVDGDRFQLHIPDGIANCGLRISQRNPIL